MIPVVIPGGVEIRKPKSATDEECSSICALIGETAQGWPYFLTAWKPSYEDLKALEAGRPVYVLTYAVQLPPMLLYTADENERPNI